MNKAIFLIPLFFLLLSNSFRQEGFYEKLSDSALELTSDHVQYDPAYFTIGYPNGDVPPNKGVCTDVVIRAYRKLGIDLQKEVHEDMAAHFNLYPKIWGQYNKQLLPG